MSPVAAALVIAFISAACYLIPRILVTVKDFLLSTLDGASLLILGILEYAFYLVLLAAALAVAYYVTSLITKMFALHKFQQEKHAIVKLYEDNRARKEVTLAEAKQLMQSYDAKNLNTKIEAQETKYRARADACAASIAKVSQDYDVRRGSVRERFDKWEVQHSARFAAAQSAKEMEAAQSPPTNSVTAARYLVASIDQLEETRQRENREKKREIEKEISEMTDKENAEKQRLEAELE
eukprot:4639482-Prymnesium_polylepis.1